MTFEERMAELGVDLSDLPDDLSDEQRSREIIDRMETRIVNLTGELNYVKDTFRDCATCTVGSIPHSDKCDACDENFSNYEFAGVLENWRADDGKNFYAE